MHAPPHRSPFTGYGPMLLAVLTGLAIMWAVGFARNMIAWSTCGQDFGESVTATLLFDGPSAGECVLMKAGKALRGTLY